jgi:hypothetical protein
MSEEPPALPSGYKFLKIQDVTKEPDNFQKYIKQ